MNFVQRDMDSGKNGNRLESDGPQEEETLSVGYATHHSFLSSR